MPHFNVEYSANLADRHDMQALADVICDTAVETGVFPLGGIRVRVTPFEIVSIADKHPRNAFVSLFLRMGAGRDLATKKAAGQAVFDAVCDFFADELKEEYLMISLDILENDPEVSFKRNTVHARLKHADS